VRSNTSNRLAVGCLYKQPTGVVQERGGGSFFQPARPTRAAAGSGLRKVSESTGHCSLLIPFAVTLRRSRDARINQRIDSLPCPALLSMFPGRLVRFALMSSADADSTKQQRSAWPGSNYVWIMQERMESSAEVKREVAENGRDGGERGCVMRHDSKNWPTDENR